MTKKKKIILISAIAALVCALAGIITIFYLNEYYLELNIKEETTVLEYGVDDIPEITALCKGTIINKEGTPVDYEIEGELDFTKLGTYNVTFLANYKDMEISETRTFVVQDTQAPTIELVTIPDHFTSPVGEYEEEGFTATDNYDGDLTEAVMKEIKDGIVTYTVSDSSGNTATAERTIIYKDVVLPVITLNGGNNTTWSVGKDYSDPGFTATDDVDGDITANVSVKGTVDGKKEGTYTLTYDVSDSSGNICIVERKVMVKDGEAPSIKLAGEATSYILLGTAYSDPGFTASDNKDGDMTAKVVVSGGVDTSKIGKNTITYQVTDSAGNSTTVTRSIYVYKKQDPVATQNPGNKVVYLTFDDGPTKYTSELLKVLDKYGVKATFFVTNQYPAYQGMIGETARRGHTIALHTYTHNFSQVYSNIDSYFADLQSIQDVVVSQTGKEANIIRFPGGTSNTASKKYCAGIMTEIVKTLPLYGYQYCDWNVDSRDAGGTTTASGVAQNVISGMQKYNVSIVLQHDTKSYSVKAVDEILAWGIANGYTFLPMSSSTPMVHHPIKN